MPFVRANELAIGYDLAGSSGPPVVFLHGVGSDRSVWRRQLAAFAADYRAIAIDLRGHGESEAPPAPIDRAGFAADVAGVLRALALEPAHLVGLSMGGVVALETYARTPELVRSLTLADTFARYPGWEEATRARERDLRELGMREIAERRIPACLRPDADPETLREAVEAMARKDERVYRESSLATWSPDFRSLLPSVAAPTLVLWGDHDDLTPRALSEELRAGIPGSMLRVIPAAGHISNLDNPLAFNAALHEFLEQAEAPAAGRSATEGAAL